MGRGGWGGTVVLIGRSLDFAGVHVLPIRVDQGDLRPMSGLADKSRRMTIPPKPRFLTTSKHGVDVAVLLPKNCDSIARLPVLLDPYGGPWFRRVVDSPTSFSVSQWFAEQGFLVVVADGRGTPGKGRTWEKAVAGDLASVVLSDQLEALDEVAAFHPQADLSKVAIRGWSFGGYLAALAAIRFPDRIHVAVAGAPVTNWRFYDTHYSGTIPRFTIGERAGLQRMLGPQGCRSTKASAPHHSRIGGRQRISSSFSQSLARAVPGRNRTCRSAIDRDHSYNSIRKRRREHPSYRTLISGAFACAIMITSKAT